LNDSNTNNNTSNVSSLIDVFFQNGFEINFNNKMYEIITGYAKAEHSSYYFLNVKNDNYRFIEIDKQKGFVQYRFITIDMVNDTAINSEWMTKSLN
jgi:hypothetical protein